MNLLKLTLNNWRVFYGKRTIEFSNDTNKNVTLVHAENSMGKTTMLNAIKWCLYANAPDFENEARGSKILNHISHDEKDFDCYVEIEFSEEGKTYTAKREAKEVNTKLGFPGEDRGLTILENDEKSGSVRKKSNPQTFINSILPEELSDYFLFAGETYSKNRTGASTRELYKKAVRDILGFTLSDSAVKDLSEIEKKSKKELTKLQKEDQDTTDLADQIEKLTGAIDTLTDASEILKENINGQKLIIDGCIDKILKSNHHEAEDLQRQIRGQETLRDKAIIRQTKHLTERQLIVNDYGYAIFGYSLKDKMDFINHEDYVGKIPGKYYVGFVDELLKKEECICHRPLDKGSSEYIAVESLKADASTDKTESRVRTSFNALGLFNGRSKEFLKNDKRIDVAIDECGTEIASYETEITTLRGKLSALNIKSIDGLLAKQKKAEDAQFGFIKEKNQKDILIDTKQRERNTKQNELDNVAVDTEKITRKKQFIRTVNTVGLRILDHQSRAEQKARKLITGNVQTNLDDCLRKNFTVSLDHDYNLVTTFANTDTIATGTGQGQALLTNLSFITALISHSKKRASAENRLFVPGTIAPFVIDAPFAEMDGSYQKNTLGFLPNQSHQLILFLSTGQWDSSYEKVIGDKIGKRYYLLNHIPKADTPEDQVLKIKNKEFILNVNDSKSDKYPMTTIEEMKGL